MGTDVLLALRIVGEIGAVIERAALAWGVGADMEKLKALLAEAKALQAKAEAEFDKEMQP